MTLTERAKELYGRFAGSRRAMTVTVCLGLAGMLMILFSGGKNDEAENDPPAAQSGSSSWSDCSSWSDYRADTERRLESILSAIDGVGRVRVMVTVGSTEEYIYAEEENTGSGRSEREYATVRKDKGEEALVKKINTPVITGVAAVCEGADSDRVREEVYMTVTSVLGISPRRVYVAKME